MTVPNIGEGQVLRKLLNQALTLKLYSNDVTPAEGDIAALYTEVAGGGYASKSLAYADWVFTEDDPSDATYPIQIFTFTGPTNAPGVVYGYYIVDSSDNLIGVERFPALVLPFTPAGGSIIRITPVILVS